MDQGESTTPYDRHRVELFASMLPYGGLAVLCGTLVYGIADALSPRTSWIGHLSYYPIQLIVIGITWRLLWRKRHDAPWVTLLVSDLVFSALLCGRMYLPEISASGTGFILGLKMVSLALFVPWTTRMQTISNVLSLSVYCAILYWRSGWSSDPILVHQWLVPFIAAIVASLGCARMDSHRRLLFERNTSLAASENRLRDLLKERDEQASVAQALVDIARELVSTLDRTALLDRMSASTAKALGADFSHVFMRNAERQEFDIVAGYGDTPEAWESLRVMHFPQARMQPIVDRIDQEGLVQIGVRFGAELMPSGLQNRYGITHGIFALLRVGGEPIGILSAGFRGRTEPFGEREQRILRGTADIAALALTNARLVQELHQANAVRSDFVASMSHELRTPLNVIIGYHDMLLDQELGALSPSQRDILSRLRINSLQLLELVNATLDLSRLESKRVSVNRVPVDIGALLAAIETETREANHASPLQLHFPVAPGLPTLSTDLVKLKVILKSLISNAIKFTPSGSVTINAVGAGDAIAVEVIDTGIGIQRDALTRIFEPFTQADASISERFGGTGLGLDIVRRLVDVLGGNITVESELGRGSTFRVSLPVDHFPAEATAAVATEATGD